MLLGRISKNVKLKKGSFFMSSKNEYTYFCYTIYTHYIIIRKGITLLTLAILLPIDSNSRSFVSHNCQTVMKHI